MHTALAPPQASPPGVLDLQPSHLNVAIPTLRVCRPLRSYEQPPYRHRSHSEEEGYAQTLTRRSIMRRSHAHSTRDNEEEPTQSADRNFALLSTPIAKAPSQEERTSLRLTIQHFHYQASTSTLRDHLTPRQHLSSFFLRWLPQRGGVMKPDKSQFRWRPPT